MSIDQGPSGREVFEILVREHADMLAAYTRSLAWSASAADDLFQETMLTAWRHLGEYDRSRPFGPWLRGIARNLSLSMGRSARAVPLATDAAVLDALESRYARFLPPGTAFRERVERLEDCLQRLPEAMREVIDMMYARGLLLAQIAGSIGDSEESVKKRAQRARKLLAQCVLSTEQAP
ncbi:MAG: sigma-70 family RNA polymerase sigma factor [Phycisphaeraceae bacterium]|nr:sigma-70 family RNA polymerase sigma factor [Phycisphaerae bacterium]MBX3392166.1 sigma-70 family RNA polymerase sigma factor [Phycisphaeraceae bacterium]HRJ49958.1 sigma-70 family RNA polymerase sigma factor [Phycisphaerales bacterium]